MKTCASGEAFGREHALAWLAIGNFDGLHLGHRQVIARLVKEARACGAPAAVMTFHPHPAAVLGAGAPPRLFSDAQREEILGAAGVDVLLAHPFDADLAALEPESFARDILVTALRVRGVVVGEAFRFGRGRAGTAAMLEGLLAAGEPPVPVVAMPALEVDGEVVSSTRIRAAIAAGRDDLAETLLGRPYVIEGVVVAGDRRGRDLGFPTANVESPGMASPGRGVHACRVRCGGTTWDAVANVGLRPTFGGGASPRLEVHVLGEPGDLYGATLRVAFVGLLRAERAFDGPAALVAQIARDVDEARAVLARRTDADSWPGF